MRTPHPVPCPVRLLTHNIRYATTSPFKGEEPWEIRRPRIINELRFNTTHIPESFICLQEVLHHQLLDVLGGLNKSASIDEQWTFIGVGRNDGHAAGEYSPILYRPAVWILQNHKTMWLSETPQIPSKGWDAASIRILTIGKFSHRRGNKDLVAMNTHLDDQGSQSRNEAAKIILEQIAHARSEADGVFLAGDFNSEPEEEAYLALTHSQSPVRDLQTLVKEEDRYGNINTFTGFRCGEEKRIDFIFIDQGEDQKEDQEEDLEDHPEKIQGVPRWDIKGYGVLENLFEDEVYSSDHRAIVGDLILLGDLGRL
ncbi:hypothetical protein MMC12_000018 [Toensbergia leucococca]|nr:hypothetical protein [Toensbergia leucococca]